jgi:hypothetical protein
MSEMSRRNLLGATAAAGTLAAASAAAPSFAQSGQPPWGPGPAPLLGAELPSFRYPLGEKPAKTYDGGWARRRRSPNSRCRTRSPAC